MNGRFSTAVCGNFRWRHQDDCEPWPPASSDSAALVLARETLGAGNQRQNLGLCCATRLQRDPYWRDNLPFYEYFHGDNGAGIGASHQTGWTGVIAALIEIFGKVDAEFFVQGGRVAAPGREQERI
jgi:hypothetical protein